MGGAVCQIGVNVSGGPNNVFYVHTGAAGGESLSLERGIVLHEGDDLYLATGTDFGVTAYVSGTELIVT